MQNNNTLPPGWGKATPSNAWTNKNTDPEKTQPKPPKSEDKPAEPEKGAVNAPDPEKDAVAAKPEKTQDKSSASKPEPEKAGAAKPEKPQKKTPDKNKAPKKDKPEKEPSSKAEPASEKPEKPASKGAVIVLAAVLVLVAAAAGVFGFLYFSGNSPKDADAISEPETTEALDMTEPPLFTAEPTAELSAEPIEAIDVYDYIGFWYSDIAKEWELNIVSVDGNEVFCVIDSFTGWSSRLPFRSTLEGNMLKISENTSGYTVRGTLYFEKNSIVAEITTSTSSDGAKIPVGTLAFTRHTQTSERDAGDTADDDYYGYDDVTTTAPGAVSTTTPASLATAAPTSSAKPNQSKAPTQTQAPATTKPAQGSLGKLDDFYTESLDGTSYSASSLYSGKKLTMINVWSTTNGTSIKEMSTINKLTNEFGIKGLKVYGILYDSEQSGKLEKGKDIVASQGTSYVHLRNVDSVNTVLRRLGINNVPATIFVDSQGNVLKKVLVAGSYDYWKSIITELLSTL